MNRRIMTSNIIRILLAIHLLAPLSSIAAQSNAYGQESEGDPSE